jgi:hypothetical protein
MKGMCEMWSHVAAIDKKSVKVCQKPCLFSLGKAYYSAFYATPVAKWAKSVVFHAGAEVLIAFNSGLGSVLRRRGGLATVVAATDSKG